MSKNIFLYNTFITISLGLIFSLNLLHVNAQPKDFTVDSILINNEEININDGCNLNLKYNDVIRLAGRTNPNSEVAVFFADQEYTAKSDNNGNWVILISVPYIKNGEYKLLNKADNVLICRIQLNIKSDVSSQNNNDSQDTKNNTLIYTITSIIVFSVVIYLYSKNIKRKKSSESS